MCRGINLSDRTKHRATVSSTRKKQRKRAAGSGRVSPVSPATLIRSCRRRLLSSPHISSASLSLVSSAAPPAPFLSRPSRLCPLLRRQPRIWRRKRRTGRLGGGSTGGHGGVLLRWRPTAASAARVDSPPEATNGQRRRRLEVSRRTGASA